MTKREQKLVELIRRVHGLVDSSDIEKKRQSQGYIGTILGNILFCIVMEAAILPEAVNMPALLPPSWR